MFGSGHYAATGFPDKDEEGIVCFITVAGFLNGPGFREDARRSAADLLRDLGDRLLAGRPSAGRADAHFPGRAAAGLHRACRPQARQERRGAGAGAVSRVAEGQREEKFAALAKLSLAWRRLDRLPDWLARPFLPAATGAWATFPALKELFIYDGSGVMPGRTWIIAPDVAVA